MSGYTTASIIFTNHISHGSYFTEQYTELLNFEVNMLRFPVYYCFTALGLVLVSAVFCVIILSV